jgi:hypothetical protein
MLATSVRGQTFGGLVPHVHVNKGRRADTIAANITLIKHFLQRSILCMELTGPLNPMHGVY